jgi:hypothetical protein
MKVREQVERLLEFDQEQELLLADADGTYDILDIYDDGANVVIEVERNEE